MKTLTQTVHESTRPETDPLPTWDDVEQSEWFQRADAAERRRIVAYWAGELRHAAVSMPDYTPESAGWLVEAEDHARNRVEVLERAGGKVKQAGKLFVRGATSEGLYFGLEGLSRMASHTTPQLVAGVLGTDAAGLDVNLDRLRARRRELLGEAAPTGGFASAESMPVLQPDEKALAVIDAEIGRLQKQKTAGDQAIASPFKWYADAVNETRAKIKQGLPVAPESEQALWGQISQGVGQAIGTLPTYAVPGLGSGITVGQLYQEGYEDARNSGASETDAHDAGVKNVPAASLEYLSDKLIIGKVLKPLSGKLTIRQLLTSLAVSAASEGATEGAQQAWQNYVAASLSGYDPDRTLDDEVINAAIVGVAVGSIVGGGGPVLSEGARRLEDDDSGQNRPESRRDLRAQQKQLLAGDRDVQMFPTGTKELGLPKGMSRVETPRGVFHFNPRKISREQIVAKSADAKENELLGLGPYSKVEVERRAAAGEPVAVATERGPQGEELHGAAVTPSTAPETIAEMEGAKSGGSKVQLERLEDTLARRVEGEPNERSTQLRNLLWRQMQVSDLAGLLKGEAVENGASWFAADIRELALGQGDNRGGVVVEFDGYGLTHRTAPPKPGMDFLEQSSGSRGEVVLPFGEGGNTAVSVRAALRALEMTSEQFGDISSPGSAGAIARRLLDEGWRKSKSHDGLIRLERPRAVSEHTLGNAGETNTDYDALASDVRAARERVESRPTEAFKAELGTPDTTDMEIVSDLSDYAQKSDRPGEDFGSFAQRMRDMFGDKVGAYLPMAWDSVSGGKPVMDLNASGSPGEIEGTWMRALKWGRLFWEGSAGVLRRGGFIDLASAVDRHVDLGERNIGQAWGFVKPALERYTGMRGAMNADVRQQVRDEFADYYRAKENDRAGEAAEALQGMGAQSRELVSATERLFSWTGYQMQRIGVRVQDRETGDWRPVRNLGKDNWPRMLNDETAAILRDPSSNPERWEQMRQELLENGNIQSMAEADRFLQKAMPRESSEDFMANLELARSGRLPESWMDYDPLTVLPRFIARWTERMAQIEAFGQKAGFESRDVFDRALEWTRNATSRNYIMATREHAFREWHGDPELRKTLGNVTAATTGLMLGNPYSAARNLIGGVAQTVNEFGALRSIGALRRVWSSIDDAELAGAVKADVADLLFAGEGSDMLRKSVNVVMKAGGFAPAETFVRTHSWLTAKAFLRDAITAARRNPFGRKALQYRAFIKRLGIDADAVFKENMKGPLTDAFLRGAVREGQGGYRYNQVPLFVDSPLGRFFFQFARWGTQAARFHAHYTFAPAVFGEAVQVNEGGKVVEKRVRTLMPLLRSPLVAMGAGALTLAMREAMMGIERNDPEWDEIWRTKDDDAQRAFTLAFERALNDVIYAGTFGAITDYGALLKDAATRTRFKNPVQPPAVSILESAGVLAYKLAQQGQLTREDYERFFSSVVSAYRVGSRMAYNFADKMGADWRRAKLERAENDRRFVRSAGYRFADEMELDDNPYRSGWLPTVSERTPVYNQIEDALLLGDALEANRLAVEFLLSADEHNFKAVRSALAASVRSRQPIKPGGSTGHDLQDIFMSWARMRLSDAEYRRIVDTQTRYLEAAERAQILPVGNVWKWRQMANKPKPPPAGPRVRGAAVFQGLALEE